MQLEIDSSTLTLARDTLLSVQNGRGTRLLVRSGSIWVTQEGESKDSVVRAGQVFTICKAGRTVISAFEAATLSLISADASEAAVLRHRLRRSALKAEPVPC